MFDLSNVKVRFDPNLIGRLGLFAHTISKLESLVNEHKPFTFCTLGESKWPDSKPFHSVETNGDFTFFYYDTVLEAWCRYIRDEDVYVRPIQMPTHSTADEDSWVPIPANTSLDDKRWWDSCLEYRFDKPQSPVLCTYGELFEWFSRGSGAIRDFNGTVFTCFSFDYVEWDDPVSSSVQVMSFDGSDGWQSPTKEFIRSTIKEFTRSTMKMQGL